MKRDSLEFETANKKAGKRRTIWPMKSFPAVSGSAIPKPKVVLSVKRWKVIPVLSSVYADVLWAAALPARSERRNREAIATRAVLNASILS